MTWEEFDSKRREFRSRVEAIHALPEAEQDWNAFGDWLDWDCIVTCRTEGCRREGFSHPLRVSESVDNVYRVLCAGCMRAITDIDPNLEDYPDYRLNMLMPDGTPGVAGVSNKNESI